MLLRIARLSLWNRRVAALLCVLSISISVFVMLGVEFIREESRNAFNRTLSGADLVVGARTSQLNLLLYSIFRIGDPTNNVSWQSYQQIAELDAVSWTIPLSLGDSHRGYRVVGTTSAYFEHYRYGDDSALILSAGDFFSDGNEAVIGSNVARKLKYGIGEQIILAHGTGETSFQKHEKHPFTITGILKPTGTPVDDSIHVTLDAIDRVHSGGQLPATTDASVGRTITAVIVGLSSRMQTFRVQRIINDYRAEPLLAILPGVALSQLWRVLGAFEGMLRLISVLVLVSALLGMGTMLLTSVRERRGEIAILRAVGASPWFIFLLIQLEALLLAFAGIIAGMASISLVVAVGRGWLQETSGIFVPHYAPTGATLVFAAIILLLAACCAAVPAIGAYKLALGHHLARR